MYLLLLMCFCAPLLASEVVPKHRHHKDITIVVSHDSPSDVKDVFPAPAPLIAPVAVRQSCCHTSNCDMRLKVAIVTAAASLLAVVATSIVASQYKC